MSEEIESVRIENGRLKSHIKSLVQEITEFKAIVSDFKTREDALDSEKAQFLKDKQRFEIVKSARLAELTVKLEQERDIYKSINLFNRSKDSKTSELKLNLEEAKNQTCVLLSKKHQKIKKLKSTILMKNAVIRKLESKLNEYKTKVDNIDTNKNEFLAKQVEITQLLKEAIQNCASLEREKLVLESKINLLVKELETKDNELNNVNDALLKLPLSERQDVRNTWQLPDGSTRVEYLTGIVETLYPNGDKRTFNPENNETIYYYAEKDVSITKTDTQRSFN